MIIKSVDAKSILDSRGEKTICVELNTDVGKFCSSSPSGKSKGKNEVKPYKRNLEGDIKKLKVFSDYFSEEILERFSDLKRIEDILEGHVGANTCFAFESATLRAIAKEQKKEIWELINPKSKTFPGLVGNCIGGGKHSIEAKKRPDFQEFLLIPRGKSVKSNFEKNRKMKDFVRDLLNQKDKKFEGKKNDENAWMSSLNDRVVLDILSKTDLPLGLDVAASGFYKRNKYNYKNPLLKRTPEEQLAYLSNLIKKFNLFYIEDPFEEEDFESHAKILEKFPKSLIVGDDLTTTNPERVKKAIKMKSINALIVKPNQIGSLLKVKEVCEIAKKHNLKIIFSHRSGETEETILADLAFGFQADFFKCGTEGDVRVKKIERLMDIEKYLNSKN